MLKFTSLIILLLIYQNILYAEEKLYELRIPITHNNEIVLKIEVDPNKMKKEDYTKITLPFMDNVQEWINNLPRDTDSIATFKWAKSVLGKALDVFLNNAYDSIIMSGVTGGIMTEVVLDESIVTVIVEDEGIGIPEDERGHIFRKYIKSRKASLDKDLWGKAGMDLRQLYRQIHALGGSINAYNKSEKGTIFRCSIPIFEDRLNMKRKADKDTGVTKNKGERVCL